MARLVEPPNLAGADAGLLGSESDLPVLVCLVGPTGSGKSALALRLAESVNGEIVSCDSVAVYRGLDIGAAKPSLADRQRVPHYGLDLLDPDQPFNAGDYARYARQRFQEIAGRGRIPILAGGTGLYLRATLDGLAPSPPRDEALRERLRHHAARRGPATLHRLLTRFDPTAAALIHPNDQPKLIRSLEVTALARRPQTVQWQAGRDPLSGFRVLQVGLNPPRDLLYRRINDRAAAMFSHGLLEETRVAAERFGENAQALGSLGYAQALAVLRGQQSLEQAITEAQQGHRNYAKRQLTWFRRDQRTRWFAGFGDDLELANEVLAWVGEHLKRR